MPGFEVFGEEEKREVMQVLENSVLFRYGFEEQRGEQWKVRQFEEAFARYTGAAHAQAVNSGTAALKVALLRSEERRVGKECRSRWSPYH